jgi:hypothetical protein
MIERDALELVEKLYAWKWRTYSMTLSQAIDDLFDLYVFSRGVQIVVQEGDRTSSPGLVTYFIKFDSDLSADTCVLCALDPEVVAQVENDRWYASFSVELRGFTFLQDIIDQHRFAQHLKSKDGAICGILTINAPSSDHWVEPLVDCTKQFTLDPTRYGQLIAYGGEMLDDLQLIREWWKFIKSLFSSETTQREWQTYRQTAGFIIGNCGTWDSGSLRDLLLLCMITGSLDSLFSRFPTVMAVDQAV